MLPEEKTMLLNSFIKDYPSTTSADWQAFVLGVERTLDYLHSKEELTEADYWDGDESDRFAQ